MGDVEGFETADAGASETIPMEAGQIRKGGYIMIKEQPCKVSEVTSSKTGKHGHAKCHFVAINIFTGKKIEDLVPASHTTYAPFVKKMEYQFLDVDEDGFISCMTEDGTQREDLKIPDAMSQPPPVRCAPPPSASARASRRRQTLAPRPAGVAADAHAPVPSSPRAPPATPGRRGRRAAHCACRRGHRALTTRRLPHLRARTSSRTRSANLRRRRSTSTSSSSRRATSSRSWIRRR